MTYPYWCRGCKTSYPVSGFNARGYCRKCGMKRINWLSPDKTSEQTKAHLYKIAKMAEKREGLTIVPFEEMSPRGRRLYLDAVQANQMEQTQSGDKRGRK